MEKSCKRQDGITLIALVITIIVLLILAGISIAMLTGDNGLLTKASTAKTLTQKANWEEQIKLAVMTARMGENTIGKINETILEGELAKVGITADMIEKSPADANGSTLPWIISDGTSAFEVDKEGNVTAKGTTIQISGLTIKNGETVLTDEDKSIPEGTPLTINFTATITDGTITSISLSVPYTPEAGNVKTSETFVIKGKSADGTPVERTYVVNLKGYYDIPDLKVGDYVNYTPSTVTDAQLAALNKDINDYSGYSTTQTLSQNSLQWRVLEIDNEGNPTKLISASPTSTLYLSGANGYNNAVYLLNKACSTLYSGEYGDAQSITIEDLEKHYSDAGKEARDGYTGAVQYGKLKRYTGNYANYPKLATQENKMGIDTETYTDDEGNTFNTIKTDGINLSDKQTEPYNEGSARANTNGITITQTFYGLGSVPGGLANAYVKDDGRTVYYELFHSGMDYYWLASRCFNAYPTAAYCRFSIRLAHSSGVTASGVFYSNGIGYSPNGGLRPVVSLKSGVKADYPIKGSTYNTWNLSM